MRDVRDLAHDERGNAAILFVILLPILIGGVTIAVSHRDAQYARVQLQGALDNAVLAGVLNSGSQSQQVATAQNFFTANTASLSSYFASGVSASFTPSTNQLSGTANGVATAPFGGLFGFARNTPIQVGATATKKGGAPLCVLALNSLAGGAVDGIGNSQVNAQNCGIQANSTSSTGMVTSGGGTMTAQALAVSGGYSGNGFSVTPTANAPTIADPYSSMPFPSYSTCSNFNGISINQNTTLSPGTYCGGITIQAQANVTLQPGIYIMNGGPLNAKGGAVITGSQVMIGFTGTGATLALWGNSTMSVTSPTSGTYTNVQFMQDPAQPTSGSTGTDKIWFSVGGSNGNGSGNDTSKLSWDGLAYIPRQEFWTYGQTVTNANSPGAVLVTDQMWPQGNSTINFTQNNDQNLNVTAPIMAGSALLTR